MSSWGRGIPSSADVESSKGSGRRYTELLLLPLAVGSAGPGAHADGLHDRRGHDLLHHLGGAVGLLGHGLDGAEYPVDPVELVVHVVHGGLETRHERDGLYPDVIEELVDDPHGPDELVEQPRGQYGDDSKGYGRDEAGDVSHAHSFPGPIRGSPGELRLLQTTNIPVSYT